MDGSFLAAGGWVFGGLILLVMGGELLVRGASALAAAFQISPLIIGLTVVAFGTSAPELGVSLQAAYGGYADVAVGNVVGSNIFNVLVILGLAALVTPLAVSSQLIRIDVPLMVAVSILAWVLSLDGAVSRIDGGLLFVTLLFYIGLCIRNARREPEQVQAEFAAEYAAPSERRSALVRPLVLAAAGLGCLVVGSRWLVAGAIEVATGLGVSELVIGLTIVAAGTSLPEVVTSVVASFRGQRDIAVGNVIGSNLFNLAAVLGLSAVLAPGDILIAAQTIRVDMPVMIAVAAACVPIFLTGRTISRLEGTLFLSAFVIYTIWLVRASPQ